MICIPRRNISSLPSGLYLFCILLVLQASPAAVSAQQIRNNLPGSNGTIRALCVDEENSTVYLGGSFNYIGIYTGQASLVHSGTVTPDNSFPVISGDVLASAGDGSGGWYLAGSFIAAGLTDRHYLVHIRNDNSVDTLFNPRPDGQVHAIVLYGGRLYVSGSFDNIGGKARKRLASLDPVTGNASGWNPALSYSSSPTVYALCGEGGYIFVGGRFNAAGDSVRGNLAKIDTAYPGRAAAWNPQASSYVRTIAVHAGYVYIGGDFQTVNSQSRKRLAKLSCTASGRLSEWNPSADQPVYALCPSGDKILAGGNFTKLGSTPCRFFASLDTSKGNISASGISPDSTVRAICISSQVIYLGGEFHNISGYPRNHLAKCSINGSVMADWQLNTSHAVRTISSAEGRLLAGGEFNSIGGEIRNNLAALSIQDGAVRSWNPSVKGEVRSLALSGSTIFAGGKFTMVSGAMRNNLAAIDKSSGAVYNWNPGADSSVEALLISSNLLYAGGRFTHLGGYERHGAGAFPLDELSIASSSVSAWDPRLNGAVMAIAENQNTIFLAGSFSTAMEQARSNIASFDAANGSLSGWSVSLDGEVYALAATDSAVYIGGNSITAVSGEARKNLAAVSITAALLAWDPQPNGPVYSLASEGTTIYAGGGFSSICGKTRRRLAGLDEASAALSKWDPNCDREVYTIIPSEKFMAVFAGGSFSKAAGEPALSFAFLDDPYNTALPVELSSFTAEVQDNRITFRWRTQSEVNAYRFEIEKSGYTAAGPWEKITEIPASGTSYKAADYCFSYRETDSGRQYFRLKTVDTDGSFSLSSIIEVSALLPQKFSLEQNYPNPFNPSTTISFSLPAACLVKLEIFDILGRLVSEPLNEIRYAGYHQLRVNSFKEPCGVYFYRITARINGRTEYTGCRKMLLLK